MENSISSVSNRKLIARQDAIFSKIQQAKAVLTCIMFAIEFVRNDVTLDRSTLYNALWSVDVQLEKLEKILCN